MGLLLFASCSPKIVPLKSAYNTKSTELTSTADFEKVWEKVVAMFAKRGVVVKVIDKSSGFISVHYTSAPFTSEDKDGKLMDSAAWVVVPKIYSPLGRKYYTGTEGPIDWNIYVKRSTSYIVTINIKLVDDPTIMNLFSPAYPIEPTKRTYKVTAFTTGVFEKLFADQLK